MKGVNCVQQIEDLMEQVFWHNVWYQIFLGRLPLCEKYILYCLKNIKCLGKGIIMDEWYEEEKQGNVRALALC